MMTMKCLAQTTHLVSWVAVSVSNILSTLWSYYHRLQFALTHTHLIVIEAIYQNINLMWIRATMPYTVAVCMHNIHRVGWVLFRDIPSKSERESRKLNGDNMLRYVPVVNRYRTRGRARWHKNGRQANLLSF